MSQFHTQTMFLLTNKMNTFTNKWYDVLNEIVKPLQEEQSQSNKY
jgi:hypothetical protein